MLLTQRNLVRALFLILFIVSSIISLKTSNSHSSFIALLSLSGFILFEVIESSKRPEYKDFTGDMESLNLRIQQMEKLAQEIKSDHSAVKLSAAFRR